MRVKASFIQVKKKKKKVGCRFLETESGVEPPTAPQLQVSESTAVKEVRVHMSVDVGELASELPAPFPVLGILCLHGCVVCELILSLCSGWEGV